MVAELEYQYGAVTFGGATDYSVTRVEGLASPPDAREELIDKAIEHGSYQFAPFLKERVIIFEGFIAVADVTTLEARIASMKASFRNQLSAQPLYFRLPGQPQKRVYCTPKRRHFTMDNDYANGYSEWAAEFTAGDPRLYADVEDSITGNGTATNDGDIGTYPIVTITGPATDPSITNSTTSEELQINETLVGGDELIIDFLERTVVLNGTVSKYGSLEPTASDFFDLEPGNNSIVYAGGGTMEMRWRSAWY